MTVTYTGDVGNANSMALLKLLWRWKGSVWKAVYKELGAWALAYASLSLVYHLVLDDDQQRAFEAVCVFFNKYADFVPITFMLGFFVSIVISRWWDMFNNLGWIDIVAMHIANLIHGDDDQGRLIRRNLVRHLLFYQVQVYRDISICVRERFPTFETCVAAGYLTEGELRKFRDIGSRYPQYWTPITWVMSGLRRAHREGRIHSPIALQELQRRVMDFRGNLGTLLGYDWVPIPLLYSQVVSLSVRIYFLIAILGRQNLMKAIDDKYVDPINIYVPIMTIMQFTFYVGWLKVAEALLNPFGRDDDDFEINWLLDRNLEVGYMIIEERLEMPLARDHFWGESVLCPLYSEATVNKTHNPMIGSAVTMKLRSNSTIMIPRTIDDQQEEMQERSNSFFSFGPLVNNMQKRLSRARNSITPEEGRNSRKTSPIPKESMAHSHPPGDLHVVVEEDEEEGRGRSWFKLAGSDDDEEDKDKDK